MATFTNQATLTYRNTTTSSNIVTGELVDSITVAKTAVTDTYTAGETLTYAVSLINSGSSDMTGITVTDDLGAYPFDAGTLTPLTYREGTVRYYVNGVLQATPTVTAGAPLSVSGLSIPAGGNALLLYAADVNTLAPLSSGSQIQNTASVSAAALAAPITATATVTVRDRAALSILKAISPQTVTENGEITYTFTVSNAGSSAVTAEDGAVIADTFDPVLRQLTVSLNGTALAETTGYTYEEATGAFATVAGQLTVPAATYTQSAGTGEWSVQPGTAILQVTGTVS